MWVLSVVLLCCLAGYHTCQAQDQDEAKNIVGTPQGRLEGKVEITRGGREYYSFRGIPYAEYPGRFQVATKFAEWSTTLPAKKPGPECAQVDMWKQKDFKGVENCLFLNVFTPNPSKDAKLPVFFYIPGGALASSASAEFDGKYMLDEDIVVVSINYRLGPLGFLTFNTGSNDDIPGNLGLKDQVLALKWVKKNIASFGGDPTKVTLGGFSGGAAAAHHHTMSPLSKGLFRACIARGGTGVSIWAYNKFPRVAATKFSRALSCPQLRDDDGNVKDVVSCLAKMPVEELVRAQSKLKEWYEYPAMPFTAVVEPEGSYGGFNFLSKSPRKVIKAMEHSPVPMMLGVNRNEENLLAYPILTNKPRLDDLNNNWAKIAPVLMGYTHWSPDMKAEGSADLKDHFFPNWRKEGINNQTLIAMFMDVFFVEPLDMAIRVHSKIANVYPFIINFEAEYSLMNSMFGLKGFHGIVHGDGMQFLFPGGGHGAPDYSGDTPYTASMEFSKNFIKMMASFITNLEPKRWDGQTWTPTRSQDRNQLINYLTLAKDFDVYVYPGRIERLNAFRHLRRWDIYHMNGIYTAPE